MKLILAIVNNEDTPRATDALMKSGFFVTRLSTTGGFLLMGTIAVALSNRKGRYSNKRRKR